MQHCSQYPTFVPCRIFKKFLNQLMSYQLLTVDDTIEKYQLRWQLEVYTGFQQIQQFTEGKNKPVLLTKESLKSPICVSDGQGRWIFCPVKNISDERYMSDCSLRAISHEGHPLSKYATTGWEQGVIIENAYSWVQGVGGCHTSSV